MSVLLIRHAVAADRHHWKEDDDLRPLNQRGRDQAAALVAYLDEYSIDRILSSPSTRCGETVRPLAESRGLPVETYAELAEGSGRRAAKLVREFLDADISVVMCTHGDVVPAVLEKLGFDCHRCAKGSIWIVSGAEATYLTPPA